MPIPDQIKSFIVAPDNIKKRIDLMRRYSVSLEASIKFTKTINRLYEKEIGLNDLIPELTKTTGLPEDTVKKIILEFAGHEFLPASSYLGNVSEYIKSMGGDPASYPATRITIRSLTPEEVVSEVLHENTLPLAAHLEGRLREILESFVRGVRSKDETIHRLTRAEKIGGVAFLDADAEKIVNILAEKTASVKIDFSAPVAAEAKPRPEEVPTPVLAEVSPRPSDQAAVPQMLPAVSVLSTMTVRPPEVKREISISQANIDFERRLFGTAVRIAGGVGVPVPKELSDRLMAIIVAFLKEARKSGDTLATLKKTTTSGGMGFDDVIAQKTIGLLNDELKKIQLENAMVMKKEKEDFSKKQNAEMLERENARQNAEIAERDKLYSKLSGKNPFAFKIAPKTENAARSITLAKIVPPPVPPVAPSAPEAKPRQEEVLTEQVAPQVVPEVVLARPVAPLARVVPPPVSPVPSPSLPPPVFVPPPVAPLPKMQDIRKTALHLTGPAEELRNMNLQDFRRLSSNSEEACRKLNDKVLLLDEQSYADRAEGVKAWQESPLYKLYLSILNESFGGGGGVSAVIRARETSNKESLTEAEVRAIMVLNRKLKS